MAIRKTPIIQTQQDIDIAESDLDEEQAIEDLGLSAEEERRYVTRGAEQMDEDLAPLYPHRSERLSTQGSQKRATNRLRKIA